MSAHQKEHYGMNNRILEVDLTQKCSTVIQIAEKDRMDYLGGKGLALKILYDRLKTGINPLSKDNIIVFMTGVYMGTGAPCSVRFSAVTKSPLTGIICHASCGGSFGLKLKTSGWDGLVIKGKAIEKTYLVISEEGVVFNDAKNIWGKGTIATQKLIVKEGTACTIGPAGENMVRFANIVSEERFFGRGGMGAVFGSKNLKAVISTGGNNVFIPVHKEKFNKIRKTALKFIGRNSNTQSYRTYGTNANTMLVNKTEILPVKNFTKGKSTEAYKISGEYIKKKHDTNKQHACKNCRILCGKKGKFNGTMVPVPEYETTVLFGSNIEVYDINEISKWNQICSDMGMDTISAGGTLAWVMEATEKGLIKSNLRFGSTENIADALLDIANAKEFGKEMGKGSRTLSEKYGGKDFAIHVKGMEMGGYDPRGCFGHGLSYATANRGACHLSASLMALESFLHYLDPYTTANKPLMVKHFENVYAAINSLSTCQFTSYAITGESLLVKITPLPLMRLIMTFVPALALSSMDISLYSKLWSAITGKKLSMKNFIKAGERIHILERYMNTREGISRKDDTLPERLLKEGRECDTQKRTVPLHKMLKEYYAVRGFDNNGIPKDKLLSELSIKKHI